MKKIVNFFQTKTAFLLIGIIFGGIAVSVPWYFSWKSENRQANANFFESLIDEPDSIAKISGRDSSVALARADLNWSFSNLQGEKINIDHFKGKVVFLNFWATWCVPCIAELPSLKELVLRYQENDQISFLFITDESKGKINRFTKRRNELKDLPYYTYSNDKPTLFDSKGLPTTVIINKYGDMILKHVGMAYWDSENVHELLNDLLKE